MILIMSCSGQPYYHKTDRRSYIKWLQRSYEVLLASSHAGSPQHLRAWLEPLGFAQLATRLISLEQNSSCNKIPAVVFYIGS